MIYLHKILPVFVSPIFLILFLAVLTIFVRKRWPGVLLVCVVLIASNPYLADISRNYLEKDFTYKPVIQAEPVNAVVVLSGMLNTVEDARGDIHHEFGGSIDRFEAGVKYIKLGKADTLILTRGHLPWSEGQPEGDVLARIALERGVPDGAILLTEIAQNTEQEAMGVKKIVREDDKIALVTSAFHMPRALRLFQEQGLKVVPHPVDFGKSTLKFKALDLFPSANALNRNSIFIREMIGRIYYAVRYR